LPRLEVVRAALSAEPLYKTDVAILAIAADNPAALDTALPILPLDDIGIIGEFICKTVGINFKTSG
jgi:molybdopterin-guanine dinucleotide biosynthesis protein B